MGFLEERYAKKKEEFYSHVPVWVAIGAEACKAAGRRITWEEYVGLIDLLGGANSYTRKVLLPTLDDLAVCRLTDYCMSQSGRGLGELDLAEHYGDAVQRELAPLLVKRLRELADLHEKTLGANEAIKLERLEFQRLADAARKSAAEWEVQAQDLRDRLVQSQSELARVDGEYRRMWDHALKAERERDELRTITTKLANYLETANGLLEDNGEDEDDIADARELIAKAREILPPQPDLCGMPSHARGCDCRGAGGDR